MADDADKDKKKEGKEGKGKEGDKTPAKKSKKKLFIIIGAVVVILLIAGGSYFFLFSGGGEEGGEGEHAEAGAEDDGHGKKTVTDAHGNVVEVGGVEIVKFEPFIVNLINTAGNRYLKVTINIELEAAPAEELRGKTAQIRDSIITLLSSKSYADVGSVSGKYQLRDEIAARINLIISEGKVKSVYFTEFVIQ